MSPVCAKGARIGLSRMRGSRKVSRGGGGGGGGGGPTQSSFPLQINSIP